MHFSLLFSDTISLALGVLALLTLVGCERGGFGCETAPPPGSPVAVVERYECNRCHSALAQPTQTRAEQGPFEGGRLELAEQDRSCTGCHNALHDGELDEEYPAEAITHWQKNVVHLIDVPTLTGAGRRFRRDWLVDFLRSPHDLRPRLEATMPRFAMPEKDARAIAEYFVPTSTGAHEAVDLSQADLGAGRAVLESNGCTSCHAFGGVEGLKASPVPVEMEPEALARAMKLAPDLRYTRDRMSPAAVVAWLEDSKKIKSDSLMPHIPLSETEREQAAAFILRAELAPVARPEMPKRLPVLEREVRYAEVEREVFKKVCWHCHSDPDGNNGDGGPGNTGGFGFEGKGLDLGSYEAIERGRLGEDGERESVVEPGADGVSPLVAHMLARHAEVAGEPVEGVRGMPLGLPPMSMEKIQLVETWVAQGARQ
ncbi:c-type cytochrome [Persicimonas caeni]|nr:cytochrome c [Persicimonas caeni]